MVFPRNAFVRHGLRATRFRPQARPHAIRQAARGYASEGGHSATKSSELPWIIGSIVFTVPAAGWLISQGPDRSHHGQEVPPPEKKGTEEDLEKTRSEEDEDEDEGSDDEQSKGDDGEGEDDGKDDKPEDSEDDGKDDKGDSKSKAESKEEKPKAEKPKANSIKSSGGEESKVSNDSSKLNFRRESTNETSGAQHPYLDDDAKSKKGAGVKETSKIHGTVDSKTPLRGPGGSGQGQTG